MVRVGGANSAGSVADWSVTDFGGRSSNAVLAEAAARVEVRHGSFLEEDWAADADVVYCSSICFEDVRVWVCVGVWVIAVCMCGV